MGVVQQRSAVLWPGQNAARERTRGWSWGEKGLECDRMQMGQ